MATTIKKGDKGPRVRRWQTILLAEGFDPDGVDGTFGTDTTRATREFQHQHGLKDDGRVGTNTWAAGEAAIAQPETLRRGSRNPDVERWQRVLTGTGFDTKGVDGKFGKNTEGATKRFQGANGLPTDGAVTSPTWSAAFGGSVTTAPSATKGARSGFLKDEIDVSSIELVPAQRAGGRDVGVVRTWNRFGGLLGELSGLLDIDADAAAAVLAIESGGTGMTELGPVIRFENHKFFEHWGRSNPDTFAAHFAFDSSRGWRGHRWRRSATDDWQVGHQDGQRGEWDAFRFACEFDTGAAITSTSIGLAQIMGSNHRRIGYGSPSEMMDAFSTGDGPQIVGFFDFVATANGNRLVTALQDNDWLTFAKGYNGTGKAQQYADKMRSAYDQIRAAR